VKTTKNRLRTFVVFAALCLLMVPVVPKLKVIWDLSERRESLQKESERLHAVQLDLKAQLKEARSPAAIEKIAREKLHMVKKGETYIVEIEPSDDSF